MAKANLGTLYHGAIGILERAKAMRLTQKYSKISSVDYANDILRRGIDKDEVLSNGDTLIDRIRNILSDTGLQESAKKRYIDDIKVKSLKNADDLVTIGQRQEEFLEKQYDQLNIRIRDLGLKDAGYKEKQFADSISYSERYEETYRSLNSFTKKRLEEPYLKERLINEGGYNKTYFRDKEYKRMSIDDKISKLRGELSEVEEINNRLSELKTSTEFNQYYSGLTDTEKSKVAQISAQQGKKIESIKDGDITYYYREGDRIPPEIEAARQRRLNAKRQVAKKHEIKQQQEHATRHIDEHEIWVPKAGKSVTNKMNPTNADKPRTLTDEEIIDSLMGNADNVNNGVQSEIANPARTTLKDTLRLSETALNGFNMENAGTLIGGFGALALFEATMYANNSDAELHRRRVEEERRRKKYGY